MKFVNCPSIRVIFQIARLIPQIMLMLENALYVRIIIVQPILIQYIIHATLTTLIQVKHLTSKI